MQKVQSFAISDSDGINELLSKYRLAAGAAILISDGQACIPYEDGEMPNKAQQIVAIQEKRNIMLEERSILEPSQKVDTRNNLALTLGL